MRPQRCIFYLCALCDGRVSLLKIMHLDVRFVLTVLLSLGESIKRVIAGGGAQHCAPITHSCAC